MQYRDLTPVVSVHILGFNLLPEAEHPRYHQIFELLERSSHHRLSDHLQLHTIEVRKFLKAVARPSTDEDRWVYWLVYGHELSQAEVQALELPAIQKADEELRVISQDRILRAQYEARMKAERDALSFEQDHIAEWLDEGKRLGLDEGKRLGLDEGKRLGLQEAILRILGARGLPVSEEARAALLGCQDEALLLHYLGAAVSAASADALLALP